MLYCVLKLCSHKHTYNVDEQFLQSSGLGFITLSPFIVFMFVYFVFFSYCIGSMCYIIVTRWRGPGEIEA